MQLVADRGNQRSERFRIRTHEEGTRHDQYSLSERHEVLHLLAFDELLTTRILHHTDDLVAGGLLGVADQQALADGALSRPYEGRHGFVDDRHRSRGFILAGQEAAPFDDP